MGSAACLQHRRAQVELDTMFGREHNIVAAIDAANLRTRSARKIVRRAIMANDTSETNTLELATELTIAWLSNPNTRVSADEVPSVLEKMHGAVANLTSAGSAQDEPQAQAEFTPAVSARKSLASKD